MTVNSVIIKVIGLLSELPNRTFNKTLKEFTNTGYIIDKGPVKSNGEPDTVGLQFLRDYFYPDFKEMMFLEDQQQEIFRLYKNELVTTSLLYSSRDGYVAYPINILQAELYLFKGQIGLFSLSVQIDDAHLNLQDINSILSCIRHFDAKTIVEIPWHEWISKKLLNNWPLRGDMVDADEYSGSKFKIYSVIDYSGEVENRQHLMYDMATTTPLGSASGLGKFVPDPVYYTSIMQNRLAVFSNWEALCLFDSFCCLGNGQLGDRNGNLYKTWDYTYFRIYLYRLFFKYNLFKYNTAIHYQKNNAIKLRDEFEKFLHQYNISHISYNFLGNDIFRKTGKALEIEEELNMFRKRINSLSTSIQESRQSKTNMLLQLVAVLSGISSAGPAFEIAEKIKQFLGWSSPVFYIFLSIILITIGISILYFLMPEKFKRWTSFK